MEADIATFVALGNLTDEGLRNSDSLEEHVTQTIAEAEKLGAKVIANWALLGMYDLMLVFEAPDGETAAGIMEKDAADGFMRYQTMEALSLQDLAARLAGSKMGP